MILHHGIIDSRLALPRLVKPDAMYQVRKARVTAERIKEGMDFDGSRAGDVNERNLSWFDWSLTAGVSLDGQDLLFFESGEGVGSNYSIFMRGMDGSPAVRLGAGSFPKLSPDGKWVAALDNASPQQLELLPTGTGQRRQITHDSLEHIEVGWVPDGKAVVFTASEANRPARSYWMNVEDGKIRALTPEGTEGTLASPDGRYLLATDPQRKRWLYALDSGKPQPVVAAIKDADAVLDWEADSHSLLVADRGLPVKVARVYLDSTRREELRRFAPSDAARVVVVGGVAFSADRKSYAYSYYRILSDLYVVDGLR